MPNWATDRQLYEVRAPALLRLYPGVLHGYIPHTKWRQQWVLFGGTATAGLAALGHLDESHPVSRYSDPRPIDRAFSRLLRVGRRVGYEDPAYFSRLFTARTGMSPRAFRRSGSF